jgi:hypothetical protein
MVYSLYSPKKKKNKTRTVLLLRDENQEELGKGREKAEQQEKHVR